MDFQHTEERRALADTLDRFIAERCPLHERHRVAASPAGYSPALWTSFAELGAIGALFPPEHGGYGGEGFDIAVVFESLGRGLVLEPFLGSLMAGTALLVPGPNDHSSALAALMEGRDILAFAHEEPDGRYALDHVETTARQTARGWVLDGVKTLIRQGGAASAFVVSARTSNQAGDVSLFLVPAAAEDVHVASAKAFDGGNLTELRLTDVNVGESALVGPLNGGLAVIEQAIGAGVLALCAEAIGLMDVAKDATLEYLRTRKQFGTPIGSFQALQHRMATLLLEIEQSRSSVINAAAAFASADRGERERALSAAKFTIGKTGALVAEECIQMHGGIGMTWELPMPHYAKRLIAIDHQLGDQDFHLERYIALSA